MTLQPALLRPDPSQEFYTGERCHILELFNQPAYAPFSLARARVAPGVTTALHALSGTDEVYYLLAGEGEMETAGKALGRVGPGDLVIIPAGASQRIANTGAEDLIFLCICAPRFEAGCYRDLEGG